jgi:hypothetical protein
MKVRARMIDSIRYAGPSRFGMGNSLLRVHWSDNPRKSGWPMKPGFAIAGGCGAGIPDRSLQQLLRRIHPVGAGEACDLLILIFKPKSHPTMDNHPPE